MSEHKSDLDTKLIDLLYDELDVEEATKLREEIEADPELSNTLHAWASIQSMTSHLAELEPDPQAHYNILREARMAVSESESATVGFWARLETFFSAPAFAVLAVAVFAGALFNLLTDDIQEDPSLNQPTAVSEHSAQTELDLDTVGDRENLNQTPSSGGRTGTKPSDKMSNAESKETDSEFGAIGQLSVDQPSLAEPEEPPAPPPPVAPRDDMKDAASEEVAERAAVAVRSAKIQQKSAELASDDARSSLDRLSQAEPFPSNTSKTRAAVKKKRRYSQKSVARSKSSSSRRPKTRGPANREFEKNDIEGVVGDIDMQFTGATSGAVEMADGTPKSRELVASAFEGEGSSAFQDSIIAIEDGSGRPGGAKGIKGSGLVESKSGGPMKDLNRMRLRFARRAQASGRHRIAVRKFEEYLADAPKTGRLTERVLYEAAESYRALGDDKKALQLLRLAAQGDSLFARKARLELEEAKDNGSRKSRKGAASPASKRAPRFEASPETDRSTFP